MKKIREQEEKEKNDNEKEINAHFNITLSDKNYFIIVEDYHTINDPVLPLFQNTIRLEDFLPSIFHPPC